MYNPTIWHNHITDPSNCYQITSNGDGTYQIIPAGTVMQQGTPQDQARFNNLENGVYDAHVAMSLLLNMVRANAWNAEKGTVQLHSTLAFPFNNSAKTVALKTAAENTDYVVLLEVGDSVGNVGDIVVYDKLINGFKVAYTGSAEAVSINYTVIGGYLK